MGLGGGDALEGFVEDGDDAALFCKRWRAGSIRKQMVAVHLRHSGSRRATNRVLGKRVCEQQVKEKVPVRATWLDGQGIDVGAA
jgi:hypothetical protein